MKPRTCRIVIAISNDRGVENTYDLRPLAPADLQSFVAGFRLLKLTAALDSRPAYCVRLAEDGQVICSCPLNDKTGRCKHADALVAAGLLPGAMIAVVQQRTKLLATAEEKLAAVSARAVQLQDALAAQQAAGPKRRRPAKARAA